MLLKEKSSADMELRIGELVIRSGLGCGKGSGV